MTALALPHRGDEYRSSTAGYASSRRGQAIGERETPD